MAVVTLNSTMEKIMSTSNVKTPKFENGHHPNSVRHLLPANQWTIHIDETGNQFGDDKIKENQEEKTGKLVALIVRQGVVLPELPKSFHAVDYQNPKHAKYNPEILDTIINEILSKKNQVGILGIQYNDSLSKSSPNWWSGIITLIRLVLRLMPFDTQKTKHGTNIKIFIEQRDYKSHVNLEVFTNDLLTDLKSIDSERFGNLTLDIKFTKKENDKYNGYVDTVAHSWGGGREATQRRKYAKFSGYCFLNVQDNQIERLYAMVDDPKKSLSARDWYDIMVAAANESKYSILHSYVKNIGEKAQKDLKLWQSYLDEIQLRLKDKDYQAKSLVIILSWMDDYKPEKAILPTNLQLQLKSAKLASANHRGQTDIVKMCDVLSLGNGLIEEDAQQVAHAYLRLATAYANAFDFEHVEAILLQPIMSNKLAIGLANYAKTLSSLGQYYAFTNQPDKAIMYFNQAIDAFNKLSDKNSARKDIVQTQTYLMLAHLQSKEPARKQLQVLFGVKSLAESVEIYAKNKNDTFLNLKSNENSYKYKHQVILRMLNQGHYDDLKLFYLSHSDKWAYGTGHPWQSIYFWRGILLTEQQRKEEAQNQFDQILKDVSELEVVDKTLIWIYVVYAVAIGKLGYKTNEQIFEICYPIVKQDLQIEYYDHLDKLKHTTNLQEIRELVLQCLPFNYA